jgi:PmbA protein
MIATQLIEKTMKKAQGAQAWLNQSESTDVSFESNRLKSAESSQRTGMGIKVILDGKVGSSHTTDINDIDGVVDRALESAEFGSPAHFEFPNPQDGTDVKIYDEAVVPLAKAEMVNIGEEMIALIKEYNPEILSYAGVNKNYNKGEFANSNGIEYSVESTSFNLGVYGQLVRGTDILQVGHGFGWKKRDIDHIKITKETIERFKMAEKIAPIRSGNMPIIFPPDGIMVLLMALIMGVNGKNVFLGSSPLAGRLGEKIADEKLTITDNGLIDYMYGSSKYDGEGVPHQILPIIENGVLKNFLYDLDTAGRAGTKTNGHGVGCNPTNTIIKEGDISYEDMVKNTKEGLIVYDVMGLGQGNVMSGEFSVNVQLGYKIENGEIVGRVKDVMLTGNTYDAINKIEAISDKAEWIGGSLLAPYIKISNLSVVAK